MLRKLPKLAVILGTTLLVLSANSADAGFVSMGATSFEADIAGSDDGAESSPLSHSRQQPLPDRVVLHVDAALARPIGTFSPGGMSVPQTGDTVRAGTAAVGIVPIVTPTNAPMVAWVGAEGRSWLPPPLSTRIFRPPRSIAS